MIFTILVSFSRDNALFASKAKFNIFWNFFEWSGLEGASGVKKNFQKLLILVFEVIVQPSKTHLLTFSKVQKNIMGKKSETKIMKITDSVQVPKRFAWYQGPKLDKLTSRMVLSVWRQTNFQLTYLGFTSSKTRWIVPPLCIHKY